MTSRTERTVAGHRQPVVARFVASLLAFAAVAVAAPLGAIAASRSRFGSANPLAGVAPPWQWFDDGSTLAEPVPDDTVIDALIRLSLGVIWIAVAVIVATTVVEVVHLRRHRGLSMPSIRGLGWAQPIARFIAVGLVAVLPVVSSARSTALTDLTAQGARSTTSSEPAEPTPGGDIPADVIVADASFGERRPAVSESADRTRTVSTRSHVVQPGDSIYSIARDLAAGDDLAAIEIADAIVEANLGVAMGTGQRFTNPAYVEVGWVLQIPSTVTSPSAESTITYEVQTGDTLWDIASDELGDPADWTEIWERNAGEVMADGRTFDDPDLILPGWELELGEVETAEPELVDTEPIDAPARTATPETEAPTDMAAATPSDDSTSSTDAPRVDAPDDAGTPATTWRAPLDTFDGAEFPAFDSTTEPTVTSTTAAGITDRGSTADRPTTGSPEAPSPIRLEHAAMLAAGILALVGVRRRQRLRAARPRHRVPEPRPELIATERRLRAVDDGERALRVDVACRAAASSLVGTGSQIGWVRVSADGDVTLRLSRPADLPAPWSGDGQLWQLGAEVPIELLAEPARRVGAPCIAFVQLGATETGDDVLVDLEACGVLAVEAQPQQALQVVTGVATGLASSMHAEVAHLIGVGLPTTALLGHRNAHVVESAVDAFELAAALVGTTSAAEPTSFELRSLHTGGEMWEPAVILLGDAADPTREHMTWPTAGHGTGVVACARPGELPDAPVRLCALADTWRLVGFGTSIDLIPIGLTSDDLAGIAEILADADRPLESFELSASREVRWADDESGDAVLGESEPDTDDEDHASPDATTPAGDAEPFVGRDHRIIVGVLGAVEIHGHNGERGRFERSKTVELIAWLATHRHRSTRSGARTALWELDVRDATFANVVSEARRGLARLVPPPDGEEWVARTLTDRLPLHELVVTDADLVEARLAHARLQPPQLAIETLRPAVESIRDMPFAGTSYLWPDAEGITSNLVLLAMTTAVEFAGHALSLGDTAAVFWATGRGLQVLPGHEELIGLRMRAHAHAGDLAGVRHEWESYERVLVADPWSDGEPAPKLLALRHELLATG